MSQPKGGWVFDPEPVHNCVMPNVADRAKHYVGAIWECGTCGNQYVLKYDDDEQKTYFAPSAARVVNA